MTGPRGGVIGVKRELALEAMITQMPVRFQTSEEDPWLNGVVIRCSQPSASGLDRAGADAPAGGAGGLASASSATITSGKNHRM